MYDFDYDTIIKNKIKEEIEGLKEFIELKLVSMNLISNEFFYYIKEYKKFNRVKFIIRVKNMGNLGGDISLASIYIDTSISGNGYRFINYVCGHDVLCFDNIDELKKNI